MVGTHAHDRSANVYMGERLDVGEYRLEAGANDGARHGSGKDSTAARGFHGHAGDTVGIGMKAIEAEFIGYEKTNEDATDQADGQAKDIDEGKGLFAKEVPEGEFQVIFNHI